MASTVIEQELMYSGHSACQGCASSIAMRYTLKALGKKTMVVIPACCWSNIAGRFPYTSLDVPVLHVPFETAGAMGSAVRAGLRRQGKDDVNVLVWAGDGGTFDIGLQSLSAAVERNDDFIYVCYDNEGYMNTGGQRSSATPLGAWTTTTPSTHPKSRPKKNIVEILAAHEIPYAATACVSYIEDFTRKIEIAKRTRGSRFIHLLSPCPTGWRYPSHLTVRMGKLAVESKLFPLYEVESGVTYRITKEPLGIPVKEYFRLQNRFSSLSEKDIEVIQEKVSAAWDRLQKKCDSFSKNNHVPETQ